MRGHYYTDADRKAGAPQGPKQDDTWRLPEGNIVHNIVNKFADTPIVGESPQVIVSPETPATGADIRAIVQYVALRILQSELEWSESDVRTSHPTLVGITREQINTAITEGLA